ncbi:MAG: hypothetical protein A3K19_05425 [Lentisphaerae bacterium RIFOXYB12_FULL_65_16]|nr:MAG: hypothetical protein A3K18_15795 [Lentisphaerae bacterium RIFOXYA12_64_32]OGV94332.1 MAG: hypothetical protein A3K19_05425 [Lentisphaerae bacterium RIFOXYB12_FULL_65_16]
MKEAARLSLALGLICLVAAGLLAFADAKTREPRARAANAERQKALAVVLPSFDNDPVSDKATVNWDGGEVTFYRARKGGQILGLAGEGVSNQGYGGRLQVLVGFAPDGTLGTVLVTAHRETPGLGTRVTDRREVTSIWSVFSACGAQVDCGGSAPRVPPCTYLDQYSSGQRLFRTTDAPFRVKQDGGTVQAVAGATVSSRAVADALSRIAAAFGANQGTLLGGAPAASK